jgi:ribonuclease P protein component
LIEQLFTKGKSCKASFLRVIYTRFASQEALQSGVLVMFVVSKKNVRQAVKRNRIKRLMREAYRLEKVQLVDAVSQQEMVPIAVAIAYTGKASQIPPLALFRRELRELFTALSASNMVGEGELKNG